MEVNGQLQTPATLLSVMVPLVSIRWESGWAPESVWTQWRESNPDFLVIQHVTQPYQFSYPD
jgi:hypothetical protein